MLGVPPGGHPTKKPPIVAAGTFAEDRRALFRGRTPVGRDENTAIEPGATGQSLELVPTRMNALRCWHYTDSKIQQGSECPGPPPAHHRFAETL